MERCALISGISKPSAIGRGLAHAFLQQGYKVVGVDINELMESSAKGVPPLPKEHFHFVRGDISDPVEAKLIVDEAAKWLGNHIHVLINNAGISNPFMENVDSMKEFAYTIATNLNSAYYMSKCALPYMPHCTSSIIHISSTRALQSEPNCEAYSASKAGLCGLTRAQAITLAGKVRVNAILPGWINVDPSGEAALRPEDHQWHPAGRVGVPKDIAELCLFLADEDRAGFITGQEFVVDGGVTKKMVYPE